MPTIIATYWTWGIWFLGAITATAILAIACMQCLALWTDHFREKMLTFRQAVWVYRAMRAFERAGHPRPNGAATKDERQKIGEMVADLVQQARDSDYVVTIETRPSYGEPLAMGRHVMVYDVRPSRARYTKEA